MRRILLTILMAAAAAAIAFGADEIRAHELRGADAEGKILEMINVAKSTQGAAGEKFSAAVEKLRGAAYKETADFDSPANPLVINMDTMGNIELAEYGIAAVRAAQIAGAGVRDFVDEVRKVRYRRGENSGFASRLRYRSDWIADNTYRHNVSETTFDLPGNISTARTLDYMTRHRENYPALADSATFERQQMLEMGYRLHKIPYMKREAAGKRQVVEMLRDGDIIMVVPRSSETDVADMGIVRIVGGKVHLLHGLGSGKIDVDGEPLTELLKLRAKDTQGFRVLRVRGE